MGKNEYKVPELSTPIAFDLETVADPDALEFMKDPKPPANYKDPEKIANYIEKERRKQIEKMALNPNTAIIVACGFAGYDKKGELWSLAAVSDSSLPEKKLLGVIWDVLSRGHSAFITFHGKAFDLPFLLRRSLILGVIPSVLISRAKYDTPPRGNHYDLSGIIGEFGSMPTGGLDTMSRIVLREGKDREGTAPSDEIGEFYKQGKYEEIAKRATTDAELTLRLWDKCAGVYFVTPRGGRADGMG